MEEAAATTREEFEDNLYHIVKAWQAKTTDRFYLCYDNAKIQSSADIKILYHPHYPGDRSQAMRLDPDQCRIVIPPYSHDCNKPIEHVFATMKHRIREQLYFEHKKYTTSASVQTMVWDQFHNNFPKQQVAKDVESLEYTWEVLSHPFGVRFEHRSGGLGTGTGGNWPNAKYR